MKNFALLFAAVSMLVSVPKLAHAQGQRYCSDIRREIQDLEYRRDREQRNLRETENELNRIADQMDQARRDLSYRMNSVVSRASSVSSECYTNISRGFSNPSDQSVRYCVNSEETNSRTVCQDRGYNDPYCKEKRSCLDVAHNGETEYLSYKRNYSQLSSRWSDLKNRRDYSQQEIRRINYRIDELREELRYCR